jgi:hypothetical protein
MESSPSGTFGGGAEIRCTPHFAGDQHPSLLCVGVAFLLALSSASGQSLLVDTNPPLELIPIELTNPQAVVSGYLQVQDQLRAMQSAIEQTRWEVRQSSTKSAEVMVNALHTVQESLADRQARDLHAMRVSNKITLVVAIFFATIGFLAMLLMSYLQWRMSQGLARISAAWPPAFALGPGRAVAALGPTEQSSPRLLATTETPGKPAHEPEGISARVPNPREAPEVFMEHRILRTPGLALRRRPVKALRTAVVVGLVCALVLALVFYLGAHLRLRLG